MTDGPTKLRKVEHESTWTDERVQELMDAIKQALENDEAIFLLSIRREYEDGGASTFQSSHLFRGSRCRVSQAECLGALHVELARWAVEGD